MILLLTLLSPTFRYLAPLQLLSFPPIPLHTSLLHFISHPFPYFSLLLFSYITSPTFPTSYFFTSSTAPHSPFPTHSYFDKKLSFYFHSFFSHFPCSSCSTTLLSCYFQYRSKDSMILLLSLLSPTFFHLALLPSLFFILISLHTPLLYLIFHTFPYFSLLYFSL